ncbi:MAG: c-type cytochrome [Pseudomonadota bacterium]
MPRTASLIGAALMLGAAATAHAAPSGQTIGFTCFACHGDMGKGTATIPPLAGRSAESLYEQLIAFKTGKRPATVMDRHAKGYSDEELRAVAEYFASLPAK